MKYEEMKFVKLDEVVKAYETGKCDTLTPTCPSFMRCGSTLSKPDDHVILPDVISKEPLAPVVRQRDDDWMMIVKWTLYAMINAEELGITSKNIDEALKSKKPDVMRLVGTEGTYGEDLGLTKDWAARIIRHVGNYGEVYDRNVGAESKLAHSARAEPALERRRHPVRAADQVMASAVIASERSDEAIQLLIRQRKLDCFAEPVIGRAFARPLARNDDAGFLHRRHRSACNPILGAVTVAARMRSRSLMYSQSRND